LRRRGVAIGIHQRVAEALALVTCCSSACAVDVTAVVQIDFEAATSGGGHGQDLAAGLKAERRIGGGRDCALAAIGGSVEPVAAAVDAEALHMATVSAQAGGSVARAAFSKQAPADRRPDRALQHTWQISKARDLYRVERSALHAIEGDGVERSRAADVAANRQRIGLHPLGLHKLAPLLCFSRLDADIAAAVQGTRQAVDIARAFGRRPVRKEIRHLTGTRDPSR